jgi:predicted transcriptional regulator
MPPGKHVFGKKIKGIEVMVHADKGKYITYVDGEALDSYRSQKEAEKAGLEFVKQYKG